MRKSRLSALLLTAGALVLASPALGGEPDGEPDLTEAVVHVLDAEGQQVPGVEVMLVITRDDGSEDRRLTNTDEAGAALFPDVRRDCTSLRAVVRLDGQEVKGKPRDCGERIEAFVVLPAPDDEPGPEEAPTLTEDPYAKPLPDTAPAATPEEGPEPDDDTPGLFDLRARIGPDFCIQWFYRPAEGQARCDDVSPVGLSLRTDLSLRFEEWFMAGFLFGYRYYGSTPVGVSAAAADGGDSTADSNNAANHYIQFGAQLRTEWILAELLVLSLEVVPVGSYTHRSQVGNKTYTSREFFLQGGVSVGFVVGEQSWIGANVELVQPMPWNEVRVYRTGIISAGAVAAVRFGPGRSVAAASEKSKQPKGEG